MTEPRSPYTGKRRPKWLNVTNIVLAVVLIILVIAFCANCRGRETIDVRADAGAVFLGARECATAQSGDSAVARETLDHLVNGGIHVVSVDSMQKVLGNSQPVEAVTHTYVDTLAHDTTVMIYLRAPLQDVLEHELANAFVARHRHALIGDTAKAQTSAYYKACVRYCPKCTGAY